MGDPSEPGWSVAIARLRQQFEQAEARHQKVLEEFRNELAALEASMVHEVPPPLPPAPSKPAAVAIPKVVLLEPRLAREIEPPLESTIATPAEREQVRHSVWASPASASETSPTKPLAVKRLLDEESTRP